MHSSCLIQQLSNLNATMLIDRSPTDSHDSVHGDRMRDNGIRRSIGVGSYREMKLNEARCDSERVYRTLRDGL